MAEIIKFLKLSTRSLRLYLTIMFPHRKIHFRLSRQSDIEITEHELHVGPRRLLPDVYRSNTNPGRRAAIIIFVPLAQEGKRDKLVTNFMEGMARLGYVVMVPFWPDRQCGTIATTDTDDLAASLKWLSARPDVDPRRIGIVAVSYGVGPALRLASDARYQQAIQFIAAIGGYAEMANVVRFALTGDYDYGSIRGHLTPDPYLMRIVKTSAKRWRGTKAVTALLRSRSTAAFDKAYANLATPIKKWFHELSPLTFAAKVRAPLLILHSINDTLVPYTESLRLYDAVKHHPAASLSIVEVFEHTIPVAATPWNLIRVYLPNLWRVVRYIYRILAFQEKI